jgi:hypothetical protein
MEAVMRLIGFNYFAPTLAEPPKVRPSAPLTTTLKPLSPRMMFTSVELSANIQQYFGILKKSQLFSNNYLKTADFFFCIHP